MAESKNRTRTGCCCERMSGYDEQTQRLVVTRNVTHHCCPQHGRTADGVRSAAR